MQLYMLLHQFLHFLSDVIFYIIFHSKNTKLLFGKKKILLFYLRFTADLQSFCDFQKIEFILKKFFFFNKDLFSYVLEKYDYSNCILRQICFNLLTRIFKLKIVQLEINVIKIPRREDDFLPFWYITENNTNQIIPTLPTVARPVAFLE